MIARLTDQVNSFAKASRSLRYDGSLYCVESRKVEDIYGADLCTIFSSSENFIFLIRVLKRHDVCDRNAYRDAIQRETSLFTLFSGTCVCMCVLCHIS